MAAPRSRLPLLLLVGGLVLVLGTLPGGCREPSVADRAAEEDRGSSGSSLLSLADGTLSFELLHVLGEDTLRLPAWPRALFLSHASTRLHVTVPDGPRSHRLLSWEVGSWEELERRRLRFGRIHEASPDGSVLAGVLDHGGDVLVHSLAGGDSSRIRSSVGPIRTLAVSARARRVVTWAGTSEGGAAEDGLRLWTLEGEPAGRLRLESADWVHGLRFSPDGEKLAVAIGEGILLYDVGSGERRALPAGLQGQFINSMRFSPAGDRLAVQTRSGLLHLVEIDGARLVETAEHGERGAALCFAPDGERLVTVSDYARVWDGHDLGEIGRLPDVAPDLTGTTRAAIAENLLVTVGAPSHRVRVWDLATGREVVRVAGHGTPVRHLAFTRDGVTFVSAERAGSIIAWDLQTGESRGSIPRGSWGSPAFDLVGSSRLVMADASGAVRFHSLSPLEETRSFDAGEGDVQALLLSPDRRHLVIGRRYLAVEVWDAESGTREHVLSGPRVHDGSILELAVSPRSEVLAVLARPRNPVVRTWSWGSWEPVATFFPGPRGAFGISAYTWIEATEVVFGRAGMLLVHGLPRGRHWATLWDPRTGRRLADGWRAMHRVRSAWARAEPEGDRVFLEESGRGERLGTIHLSDHGLAGGVTARLGPGGRRVAVGTRTGLVAVFRVTREDDRR